MFTSSARTQYGFSFLTALLGFALLNCGDASVSGRPDIDEMSNASLSTTYTLLEPTEGDTDGDGMESWSGDCDDTNPHIREKNSETAPDPSLQAEYDGIDNDCNSTIDEPTISAARIEEGQPLSTYLPSETKDYNQIGKLRFKINDPLARTYKGLIKYNVEIINTSKATKEGMKSYYNRTPVSTKKLKDGFLLVDINGADLNLEPQTVYEISLQPLYEVKTGSTSTWENLGWRTAKFLQMTLGNKNNPAPKMAQHRFWLLQIYYQQYIDSEHGLVGKNARVNPVTGLQEINGSRYAGSLYEEKHWSYQDYYDNVWCVPFYTWGPRMYTTQLADGFIIENPVANGGNEFMYGTGINVAKSMFRDPDNDGLGCSEIGDPNGNGIPNQHLRVTECEGPDLIADNNVTFYYATSVNEHSLYYDPINGHPSNGEPGDYIAEDSGEDGFHAAVFVSYDPDGNDGKGHIRTLDGNINGRVHYRLRDLDLDSADPWYNALGKLTEEMFSVP